ncbi:hypothetical protein STENM327S_01683 [Streptomyces tendae]
MTVVKVRNRMRLRSGKGSPPCTVSGMEKAMARETTPRIPAQPMTNGPFQERSPSRARTRADSRGRKVAGYTHANLATATTRKTARAYQAASIPSYSPKPLRTTGSWSPMRANTADSRTKATIFHTASSWSRVAKSTSHARCPR